jgi:hypothetical protein
MFCSFNVFGQVLPTNESQVEKNNYYSYNYTVRSYSSGAYPLLDTLNNCRVRKNKIKSVTIYRFSSVTDSNIVGVIQYDTLGLTKYLRREFNPYAMICIHCDSISPPKRVPNKVTRKRGKDFRGKWVTNSDGYVVKYKRVNRGLNKIALPMFGVYNLKIIYVYDSLYLSVTETIYSKRKGKYTALNEDGTSTCYKYQIDSNGNLLSEFYYKKSANGELILANGYTYHYEYY